MKLNPKQTRFCEEYVKDLNASRAFVRAGYTSKSPNKYVTRMMAKDGIINYIAELQAKISDRTKITVEDTVKFIKEVMEDAKDNGDRINALKGADMLMKHLGGYILEPKQNDNEITINVRRIDKSS